MCTVAATGGGFSAPGRARRRVATLLATRTAVAVTGTVVGSGALVDRLPRMRTSCRSMTDARVTRRPTDAVSAASSSAAVCSPTEASSLSSTAQKLSNLGHQFAPPHVPPPKCGPRSSLIQSPSKHRHQLPRTTRRSRAAAPRRSRHLDAASGTGTPCAPTNASPTDRASSAL